jgi:PAS domain S-box-containing protein
VDARQSNPPRTPDWWLVLLSLLVLLVCLFYTYAGAYLAPYPGLDFNADLIVQGLEPCEASATWCEANQDGLEIGDQLLVVGDVTRAEYQRDVSRVPFAGYNPGECVPITFRRAGEEQTVCWQMLGPTTAGRARRLMQSLPIYVPFWLAATLVLLFVRPRDLRWRSLVAFNYVTAIWLAAGVCSRVGAAYSAVVQHASAWLTACAFLHLNLTAPSPLRRCRRYLLPPLWITAPVLAILELFQLLPAPAFNLGLLVACLGSFGALAFRLLARSPAADKLVVRLMLAGIGLALGPGVVLAVIPGLLRAPLPRGLTLQFVTFAIPLLPFCYVYAIYKRRLGALEFRANRLLGLYSFVLLYATAFSLIFFVGRQWLDLPDSSPTFSLVVSAVFVVAAPPLCTRFQRLVDRLAYGAVHDPDDVIRVCASQIPAALSLEAVSKLLADEIAPSLLVRQSALFLLAGGDASPVYARGLAPGEGPDTAQHLRRLLASAGRYRPPPAQGQDDDWVRLAIALEVRGRTTGVWLFGRRDPDDYYPQSDVGLLTTLAGQVAVALENARLYERAQREIAERKRAEESLRESEERLRLLAQNMPVMMDAFDEDSTVVAWNRECERVTGYTAEEIIGNSQALELLYPDASYLQRVLAEWARRGSDFRDWELELTSKDGEVKTVAWSNISERCPIPGWATWSIGVDVTARKRAQQQAVRAERLAAMGQMAAALTHEINSPLQAILSNLELLLTFDVEPDERRKRLGIIKRQIERLKGLTRRVLDFSRVADDTRYPTSIARLVQETLELLARQLELAQVQATADFPADLPPVFVAPGQIIQVLLNLVVNAIQAMPGGGHLHVAGRATGDRITLALTNDGAHLPAEHVERIFDPFFTTKPDGTGLGLSISDGIVRQHGGTIEVENLAGERGVCFTLTLPAARPAGDGREKE